MSSASLVVAPGDDLFRIAAEVYGDPAAWTLLAAANGLSDPLVTKDLTLSIPAYDATRANDGIPDGLS